MTEWARVILSIIAIAALPGIANGARVVGPPAVKLRSFATPNYTLITSEPLDAQLIAGNIANLERVLSKLLAKEIHATGVPTYIYVVPPRVWRRYLQPSSIIIGEFVPYRFANYLLLSAELTRDEIDNAIRHEYTHLFLHAQFRGFYPLWFDEGLAELMYWARITPGHATIGIPRPFIPDCWVPLERLFEIDKTSREYLRQPESRCVHRESWALVHRGLIDDPEFGGRVFRYLEAVDRLMPAGDAMTEAFGTDIRALGDSVRQYIQRDRFKVGDLTFDSPPPPMLGPGRTLGRAETLESLARVMLDTGFNASRADELVRAADISAPNSPTVAVLKLRLALRQGDDIASERMYQVLRDTTDPAIARAAGVALFDRVREADPNRPLEAAARARLTERAYALLDRGLRATPGEPEASWAFATLAARERRDLELALERLALAQARVPGSTELSLATAEVQEARGQPQLALPHYLDALKYSRSLDQRRALVRRVTELRAGERKNQPQ